MEIKRVDAHKQTLDKNAFVFARVDVHNDTAIRAAVACGHPSLSATDTGHRPGFKQRDNKSCHRMEPAASCAPGRASGIP